MDGNHSRMLCAVLDKSWKQYPTKTVVWSLTSHLKNHPSKTNKMWNTARKTRTNSLVMFFYGPLHMDVLVLANHREINCVDTGCSLEDLLGEWWMIRMDGERERESQGNPCCQHNLMMTICLVYLLCKFRFNILNDAIWVFYIKENYCNAAY